MTKLVFRALTMVTLAIILGAGSALAVGYERQHAREGHIRKHVTKVHRPIGSWSAPREAALSGRVPAALDQAAGLVRNFMSQFGLIDRKAR